MAYLIPTPGSSAAGCSCGCKAANNSLQPLQPGLGFVYTGGNSAWPWWWWLVAAAGAFATYKLFFTPQDRSIRRRGRRLKALKRDIAADKNRFNKSLEALRF